MQKNLFLIILASFILFATTVFATSPFPLSLTTNTLYQNTNSMPLAIYSITHSAPLSAYLGNSSSMLEVAYEDGGSVTVSTIVYSLAGYNMSSYMLVQPNEYYKFNFTSANFIGQYQPSSNSNVISGGSSQPVGFLSFYPQLETDGMLGILIYGVCILLFTLRLVKLREQNWTWVIILFASGAFCWFGFYFSVFPFQSLRYAEKKCDKRPEECECYQSKEFITVWSCYRILGCLRISVYCISCCRIYYCCS